MAQTKLNLNSLSDIKEGENLVKKGYILVAYSNNIATFESKDHAINNSKIIRNLTK